MAQANSIANTTPSRRNALTTIASLVGAAAVVTPAVAAQAIAHPDAELLALGEQLRALLPSYGAARDEHSRLYDATWAQVDRDICPRTNNNSMADIEARNSAFQRISHENGRDAVYSTWNAIDGRVWPLIAEIHEANATTLAGIAVKALATAWDVDNNGDDRYIIAPLINSIMEAAGHALPAELAV
jgi:hypothetical protein